MVTKLSSIHADTAFEWRRRYEAGESIEDIRNTCAGKGQQISSPTIKRALLNIGTVLRSRHEVTALAVKSRERHYQQERRRGRQAHPILSQRGGAA